MTSSWAYAGLADVVSATKAVTDKTESVVDAVEGKKEAVVADVKEAVVTNIKEAIPSAVKAAK